MKKIIIPCLAFLFANNVSNAQSNYPATYSTLFVSSMLTNIKHLDTTSDAAVLVALSNNFERIARAEKTKWQPYYYAAYSHVSLAYLTPDKSQIDWLADKAESLLQEAELIEKNNSEISCLQAMIIGCRIMADPMARFQTMSKELQSFLGKAKQENSNNPRIYLLQARMQLRTPEAFGGGKAIAKSLAEAAIEKFKTFTPVDGIAPSWGENYATSLLNKIAASN